MGRFHKRVMWLTFAVHAVRWTTLWCVAWGTVVLIFRAGFEQSTQPLAWGFLGLPVVLLLAARAARRQMPQVTQLAPLFDRSHRAGGLWMASQHRDVDPWRDAVAPTAPPEPRRLRWRSTGSLLRLLTAVGFLVACWIVPTPSPTLLADQRLQIDAQIETLEEQLSLLEEERWIEDEQGEALRAALDSLREEASGEDPAEAFETLDHLRQSAEWAAVEGATASLVDGERLAVAEAVSEAIAAQESSQPAVAADALSEVAAMLDDLAQGADWMSPELAEELRQAAAGESASELTQALAKGGGELQERLEQLRQAGLLDAQTLERLAEGLATERQAALEAFLAQHRMEASASLVRAAMGQPSAEGGEPRRGPGHAPLTVRDGAQFDPSWTPQVLAAAAMGRVGETELLGHRWVAPQMEDVPADGEGNPLAGASADGGAAWTHTVLPRHRRTVRSFFDPSRDPSRDPSGTPSTDDRPPP